MSDDGTGGWPPPQQPYPQQPYPQQPYPQRPYRPPRPPARRRPAHPHPEPREYHQMLRTWNYAGWKPLVGLVVAVIGFVLAQIVLIPILVIEAAAKSGSFLDNLEGLAALDSVTPGLLLYVNLTLASMIPVTWLVVRYVHQLRPRWLTSVVPKMRWRFFWACFGISVVALVAQIIVGSLVPGGQEGDLGGQVNDFTLTTVALALVVLLTTPLQAAGEEYAFRGYLMQVVGAWLGWSSSRTSQVLSKWGALLVTSTLFAMAHGMQNFPLFFDRFMFGLIAGWLVLRTGGLEAGIAMHILNNVLAFGLALSFGDISESLAVSEISWWNVPVTLTQALTYAALVVVVARRMDVQRYTTPPRPTGPGEGVDDVPPGASPVPSAQPVGQGS